VSGFRRVLRLGVLSEYLARRHQQLVVGFDFSVGAVGGRANAHVVGGTRSWRRRDADAPPFEVGRFPSSPSTMRFITLTIHSEHSSDSPT